MKGPDKFLLHMRLENHVNHVFGKKPLSRRWCDWFDRWVTGEK